MDQYAHASAETTSSAPGRAGTVTERARNRRRPSGHSADTGGTKNRKENIPS
jgi:hypothetical protein